MASGNFRQAVLEYGDKFIAEITKQLLLNNKKATGELIDSLDYRVIEAASEITLEILGSDYLIFVDKGREPGSMPPTKNIEKWINAKGIRPMSTKRVMTTQQLSFAIAKSIARNGIKPTNILRKARNTFFTNKQNLSKIIDGATLDVKQLIKEAIKNLNDQ